MAVQGIWSGTISFSLVAIPVRLVPAVEPGRVSFHLLHNKDYSPLTRRMVCPKEGTTVPRDEMIRGYEIAPDQYVLMTDEELESVSPERSRTIEIVEFIDMKEVDPIYFDHPYYLVPSKGGEKAYRLLADILRRTNKAGLAKFVLAEREYLVAVKNEDGALALITLHYSDETRPEDGLSPKKGKAATEEENRIKKSVKQMIEDFHPEKYANERRKRIMGLLEAKAKEKPPVEAPAIKEEEGEGPADLVAALEESMRKMKENR
ncbi:MAG TPA: Ku protein [Thermodesulfobacteriota bacterium]|nr:Ku protein [Thermodesulfobacteriota bacterium]